MPKVNATAAPLRPEPDFLQKWHQTTTSVVHVHQEGAGPYSTVELHDFIFLGQRFRAQTYSGIKDGNRVPDTTHRGAGVCAEFRDVLFDAQRRIFSSYAAEVTSKGENPSEAGFKSWCGVRDLSGWQFRSRQHRLGAAIDIDPLYNPYVPTGREGDGGGEVHSELDANTRGGIFDGCILAYTHAYSLVVGDPLPPLALSALGPRDDLSEAYDATARVHAAIRLYFHLAVVQTPSNRLSSAFGTYRDFENVAPSDPGSYPATLERYRVHLRGFDNVGLSEEALGRQIRDDYERMRLGMVSGRLIPAEPGHMGLGAIWERGTRDPCHGFLSIRKEIALGLKAAGCRWGAVDFGPRQSGDMMHFDKRYRIEDIQHDTDTNEQGLLYAR